MTSWNSDNILPIQLSFGALKLDAGPRRHERGGRGGGRRHGRDPDEGEPQDSFEDLDLAEIEDREPLVEASGGDGPRLAALLAAASAISSYAKLAEGGQRRPRIQALLAAAAATAPGYGSVCVARERRVPARLLQELDGGAFTEGG